MYIFDVENKCNLKDVLLEKLKLLGVRSRIPRKIKENEKENLYPEHQIFQKPLHLLKKCVAYRLDGSTLNVPEFIVEACSVIEKDIKMEGIFRKAGSTCKQKERKLELNQGKKLNCDYHVLDACSLVKLFFRELPEPLLPYHFHLHFLKSLLLATYEQELYALLLTCLLLPEENLATLAFFMEFLLKVSWHAEKNKMTVKNLAIILTPTLMPIKENRGDSNNLEMPQRFKVIEMLIENAEQIGKVPEQVLGSLESSNNKKMKKKRRSGSITRMFSGFRKIVGNRNSAVSERDDSVVSTPDSLPSFGKRKSNESGSTISLSSKRKRLNGSDSWYFTPPRCRMNGYVTSMNPQSSQALKKQCPQNSDDREQQKQSTDKTSCERGKSEGRISRINLVRRCTSRKQKSSTTLAGVCSSRNLLSLETEPVTVEKDVTLIKSDEKETSPDELRVTEEESSYRQDTSENAVNHSDNDLITVHKSEYEDIKNRVSALEEDLKLLTTVHSVQYAYEKILEESEKLSEGSTDQLAKRLSKDLKIRLSSEGKSIRSPSARKIGSFRRRSRETVERSLEPRSNLKRGRPNTVQTGLPSSRLRSMSNENMPTPKITPITRSATFRREKEEWESGEVFFAKQRLLRKLSPTQGRPSLTEIRNLNAGMVLEKAKLFNSMTESKESLTKIPRRQSIRLENLRRLNDSDKSKRKMLTRTRSLSSEQKPKNSPILLSDHGLQPRFGNEIRKILNNCTTPKSERMLTPVQSSRRETPSIKKSLVTRSPRNFAKTPITQLRSTARVRATPMKVLLEAGNTPRIGFRRSPRFLNRSVSTPSRVRN